MQPIKRRRRRLKASEQRCLEGEIVTGLAQKLGSLLAQDRPPVATRIMDAYETFDPTTASSFVLHVSRHLKSDQHMMFIAVPILLERAVVRHPGIVTEQTVVRLLAATILLAFKVQLDYPPPLNFFARIFGLEVSDVRNLETFTLFMLKFDVTIRPADMQAAWPELWPDLERMTSHLMSRKSAGVV